MNETWKPRWGKRLEDYFGDVVFFRVLGAFELVAIPMADLKRWPRWLRRTYLLTFPIFAPLRAVMCLFLLAVMLLIFGTAGIVCLLCGILDLACRAYRATRSAVGNFVLEVWND